MPIVTIEIASTVTTGAIVATDTPGLATDDMVTTGSRLLLLR